MIPYAILVTAVIAALLTRSPKAHFAALYLLSWEAFELLLDGSIFPDTVLPAFPYYVVVGVLIDFFYIALLAIVFPAGHLRMMLLLVASIVVGTMTLIEGYLTLDGILYGLYGNINLLLAFFIAVEGVQGAKFDGGIFNSGVHLRNRTGDRVGNRIL